MSDTTSTADADEQASSTAVTEWMLTTTDNPFDPFEQYELWLGYDLRAGHHTNSYLARIVLTSDDLSDADQAARIEAAIDEIVDENLNGLYRKVSRETAKSVATSEI